MKNLSFWFRPALFVLAWVLVAAVTLAVRIWPRDASTTQWRGDVTCWTVTPSHALTAAESLMRQNSSPPSNYGPRSCPAPNPAWPCSARAAVTQLNAFLSILHFLDFASMDI